MYVPPAFAMDDPDGLAAFLASHPFAIVCVNGPEGPLAAHVPLVLAEDGLIGHVARANPFWEAVGRGGTMALAVFRGADAYVSPSAYPSKAAHGKVVPTWNYSAVEARGRLTVEPDPAQMDRYITAPTLMMEKYRAQPWAVDDAPPAYLDAMKRGIVGVHLAITSLTGKQKLSQNKDDADFRGVIEDLSTRPDPAAQAVASAMTDLRH